MHDPQRLQTTGRVFCFAGRMSLHEYGWYTRMLRALHADATRTLKGADVVVEGTNPGSKIQTARALGIEVIPEWVLRDALLYGDELHIRDEATGDAVKQPMSPLMGELRSALALGHLTDRWSQIIRIMDQAQIPAQGAMVDYVLGAMRTWRPQPDMCWWPPADMAMGQGYILGGHLPRGYVRTAPDHWNREMAQGASVPKYKLVRALSFAYDRLNGTAMAEVVRNPQLTQLECLDLGYSIPSKRFVETLTFATCAATLKQLRLSHVNATTAKGFQGAHGLHALDTLRWYGIHPLATSVLMDTLHAPCFQGVRTLTLDANFALRAREVQLPIHTLGLRASVGSVAAALPKLVDAPLTQNVRVLRLECELPPMRPNLRPLLELELPGLPDVLDLSGVSSPYSQLDDLRRYLARELPWSKLLHSAPGVYLGDLTTPALTDALSAEGVHVVDARGAQGVP